MGEKMVTRYGLRVRLADTDEWGPWNWYADRKDRDRDERMNRCLGGTRTHTTKERAPANWDDSALAWARSGE